MSERSKLLDLILRRLRFIRIYVGKHIVENLDPTYDKLEKLYNKCQKLLEPEYHENGRKKRITKDRIKKIKNSETLYWREHYKCFPEDKPKVKAKRRKRNS